MLAGYLTHHADAFVSSSGRLVRAPFATLLTVLVIGLALALPLGFALVVSNAMGATGGFSGAVDLSVYFKPEVALSRVQQLAHSTQARPGVATVQVISADEALKEFRQDSGFGAALQALGSNPLPNVLRVHPAAGASAPAQLDVLKQYLAAWPEVDRVQLDSEWVLRFNAILDLLHRALAIAASLMAAGVLVVIGNTIRLEIEGRRPEIEVVRLVGGSTGFIRRPFLYIGVLYGLGGALLAWALVGGAVLVLRTPVTTLARLYGSSYTLNGPGLPEVGAVIGAGLVLGWLGAWVATARHLRGIEPRA